MNPLLPTQSPRFSGSVSFRPLEKLEGKLTLFTAASTLRRLAPKYDRQVSGDGHPYEISLLSTNGGTANIRNGNHDLVKTLTIGDTKLRWLFETKGAFIRRAISVARSLVPKRSQVENEALLAGIIGNEDKANI